MERISWRSFPCVEEPGTSAFVFVVIAGFLYIVWDWTRQWYMVALCAAVLFAALLRFFVPSRYTLDEDGVSVRTGPFVKRRPWRAFRNAYFHRVGVHLSPFEKPSWKDSFFGVFLRYSGNRERVETFVKERLECSGGE